MDDLHEEIQKARWIVEWKFQAYNNAAPRFEKAAWHDYQAAVERRNALYIEAGVDPLTEPFQLPWMKPTGEEATA